MKQTKLINTDKAWESLYFRLEQENLISPDNNKNIFRFRNIAVAASLLICLLVGTGVYILSDKKQINYVSKINNDTETTLITSFEDGSTVYLSENTSVQYPDNFSKEERRVKMNGDALFDIKKDSNKPFFVETKHALIKVLGTTFRINTGKKDSPLELCVVQGLVEVTEISSGKSILVSAGEELSIDRSEFIKESSSVNQYQNFISKIKFKDESLENILEVIKKITNTNIILLPKDLGNQRLTVAYDNTSVNSMVEIICVTLNLKYTQQPDAIYIQK